jgi:DNA-binding MarR family transcriptional regulator
MTPTVLFSNAWPRCSTNWYAKMLPGTGCCRCTCRCSAISRRPIATAISRSPSPSYLGITRGTVSQTLSVLERKGLIDRVADDRHGKRIHLTLTLAGETVLAGSWPRRLEEALAATGVDVLNVGDDLRRVLSILQRLNDRQAFGECRQCAHFLREEGGYRCGLTGEALSVAQAVKICREWRSPQDAAEPQSASGYGS